VKRWCLLLKCSRLVDHSLRVTGHDVLDLAGSSGDSVPVKILHWFRDELSCFEALSIYVRKASGL
jgi:hypothetical protein